MTESQVQQSLEAPADNIVLFPATSASNVAGSDEQMKLYTAEDLRLLFSPDSQTTRTVRDLVAKVREAYHWLDETQFKRGDKFTQFTFDQIKGMKESGLTQKQWIAQIQKQAPKPIEQPTEQAVRIDPPVSALTRIQSDRYMVPNFGSDRLAKAQERSNNQRSSLTNTRDRVRQALLGLATQTAEDTVADSLEKQAEREAIYEEAYADGLEELQIRHAAKRDAVADWEAFKAQAMGKPPVENGSSVSA
jgi:hypothetical protein